MNRVSVVIPVYNSEKTIKQAIDSVLKQTAFNEIKEIIIVDDGSTDSSNDIILDLIKKGQNIKLYIQENKGAAFARNIGMKEASGEFIAFLDADDLWLPQKIERQLQILDEHPEIVFLGTAYYLGVSRKEVALSIPFKKIDKLYKATLRDIYWKHFPTTPSVIFRRDAIDKIGYFNPSKRFGEDINYFQKFCINFNYYYLPECLVHVAFNKKTYNSSGLSSHMKEMHIGDVDNLKELRSAKLFNLAEYIFFRTYFEFKYWRRLVLKRLS